MTLATLFAAAALSAVAQDEMTSLPGWNASRLPSRQYSGYLSFGPNNRKHIHYWYVESTKLDPKDPKTPVVLWLNGGPGCSSLDGWYYENGPFRGDARNPKRLVRNNYAWDQVANMLYLEAPVGVGFSYSDDPTTDYHVNDDITANDNLEAVKTFFNLYPELKSHNFYITGESYGGVYVPTLAEAILKATDSGNYHGAPLKGIAVGNGCTGSEIGVCGPQREQYETEYILATAFISADLKKQIRAACDFSKPPVSSQCRQLLIEMHRVISDINIYDVYGECHDRTSLDSQRLRAPLGSNYSVGVGGPKACIDSKDATAYFTQTEVIRATHVKPIDFTWATCATARGWRYSSNRPNLPRDTYPYLTSKISVLIYNGDWDLCVPYTDNEAWTSNLAASKGWAVQKPWHAWTYESADDKTRQVGGYAITYDSNGFTFLTIRGGRHEVPETAGLQALTMLRRFVNGESF